MSIGKKISPVLKEIEETLWEFEANNGIKPEYTMDGFKGAVKIFMSAILDKAWELQENEDMELEDRIKMVEKLGNEVRSLIKTYTDIDMHDLYKS